MAISIILEVTVQASPHCTHVAVVQKGQGTCTCIAYCEHSGKFAVHRFLINTKFGKVKAE